jgi:L-asparaginase II
MRAYPEMVAGEKRFTTELMRAVPGLLVKEGAEGVQAAVDKDGNAIVFKIVDGSMRPIPPVLIEALKQIAINTPALDALAFVPILGGGEIVGEIVAKPLS